MVTTQLVNMERISATADAAAAAERTASTNGRCWMTVRAASAVTNAATPAMTLAPETTMLQKPLSSGASDPTAPATAAGRSSRNCETAAHGSTSSRTERSLRPWITAASASIGTITSRMNRPITTDG